MNLLFIFAFLVVLIDAKKVDQKLRRGANKTKKISQSPLLIDLIGPGVTARSEESEYYFNVFTNSKDKDKSVAQIQSDMSFFLLQASTLVTMDGCENNFISLNPDNVGDVEINLIAAKTCNNLITVFIDSFSNSEKTQRSLVIDEASALKASNDACTKVYAIYKENSKNQPQFACTVIRNEIAPLVMNSLRSAYLSSYSCSQLDTEEKFSNPSLPLGIVAKLVSPTSDGAPSLPCNGLGMCQSNQCFCQEGYSGSDCSTKLCSSPCLGNRFCSESGQCSCLFGYQGDDCSLLKCPIFNGATCGGHGYCNDDDQTCECNAGWDGIGCEQPISSSSIENELRANQLANDAIANNNVIAAIDSTPYAPTIMTNNRPDSPSSGYSDSNNHSETSATTGLAGSNDDNSVSSMVDKSTDDKVNNVVSSISDVHDDATPPPSSQCTNPCNNHGKCVFTCEGCSSNFCDCDKGWHGENCESQTCKLNCLNPRGICSDDGTCLCRNGFSGDGCEIPTKFNSKCASTCQEECISSGSCFTPAILTEKDKASSLNLDCVVKCTQQCVYLC